MIEKDLKELAISAKLHQYQGHIVLAICDEELWGSKAKSTDASSAK